VCYEFLDLVVRTFARDPDNDSGLAELLGSKNRSPNGHHLIPSSAEYSTVV
jgi:hypothetical protein